MNCAEPQDFLRSLARICDQAEGRMRTRVAKELHKPTPQVPAFQQRVLDEKVTLDSQAQKLSLFIGVNPIFDTLDPEHQVLLREQCEVMLQYSEILGKRIALFK